jgi:long-chain acyl-CoA synthetase
VRRGADLRTADVVREHAARRGDVVALRAGERALTYAELDERSNRLAQALQAADVGRGSRVAYLDRTAPEVVELLFATAKIGAVIVPLNWRLAKTEIAAVLDDSQAPVLIAGSDTPNSGASWRTVPSSSSLFAENYEPLLAAHEPLDPGHRG